MIADRYSKNQHLMARAEFNVRAEEVKRTEKEETKSLYQQIKEKAHQTFKPLQVVDLDELAAVNARSKQTKNPKERNRYHQANMQQLTTSWLNEMADSPAQLREKMALFWHGHFACRVNNSYHQELLLQSIRQHALGNFDELLRQVSKSAAMLAFLNNQQNRKKHPNENFAREVMELFTMGIGRYTEKDIKEAARAFTGWGYNPQGQFVFRRHIHDDGIKTVLGRKGNLSGDDVLDLLLEQRATAEYISTKVYRYFVNEAVNTEHIRWLSGRFYESRYNIQGLMDDIFTSDWFYDAQNIGVQIKSPVELTTGIRRALSMTIQDEETQIRLQRLLGQWLFNPPNVAGWPGGKAWIDSSSLMLRLKLPQLIRDNEAISFRPKRDDDVEMGLQGKKKGSRFQIQAQIDWNVWSANFTGLSDERLLEAIGRLLLPGQSNDLNQDLIKRFGENKRFASPIEAYTIAIMSLPEYQLC